MAGTKPDTPVVEAFLLFLIPSSLTFSFEVVPWKRQLQRLGKPLSEERDESISGQTGEHQPGYLFLAQETHQHELTHHLTGTRRLPACSRRLRGDRALRAGRTRLRGSRWAARAERRPPPLAPASLRTGETGSEVYTEPTTSLTSACVLMSYVVVCHCFQGRQEKTTHDL